MPNIIQSALWSSLSGVDAFWMSHLNILCTVHLVIYHLIDVFL